MLVIGGAMANTFLHALGTDVGKSLCETAMADTARDVLAQADAADCEIVLPGDAAIAREFKAGAASEIVPIAAVPDDAMILDIGPGAAAALADRLVDCRTLVWNGPLGAFEIPPFDAATVAVAKAAAELTKSGWSPWRAAAIRSRPCLTPAWPMISPISRPPAARFLNGLKVRNCPASRR